jgi:hypothetical protein
MVRSDDMPGGVTVRAQVHDNTYTFIGNSAAFNLIPQYRVYHYPHTGQLPNGGYYGLRIIQTNASAPWDLYFILPCIQRSAGTAPNAFYPMITTGSNVVKARSHYRWLNMWPFPFDTNECVIYVHMAKWRTTVCCEFGFEDYAPEHRMPITGLASPGYRIRWGSNTGAWISGLANGHGIVTIWAKKGVGQLLYFDGTLRMTQNHGDVGHVWERFNLGAFATGGSATAETAYAHLHIYNNPDDHTPEVIQAKVAEIYSWHGMSPPNP